MVFDCTARYKGTPLNDQPLSGLDLTNSLLGVLLRFCQELVSLSSDIEAMFHPVMVDPNDVDTPRFLWWPVMTYLRSLLSTPLGSTSSPSWDNFGPKEKRFKTKQQTLTMK